VELETNSADEARAVAVLLHPHPQFGGDRFHPFVDGLFRRLPPAGVTAVRFDFSSGDLGEARRVALDAIESAFTDRPSVPVILAGYSFGAGMAASIDDDRVAGWYLLAPPAAGLRTATIGDDPRPKRLAVPALDQFSAPAQVREAVAGWTATTVIELSGADHFLGGAVDQAVADGLAWIVRAA
jgi:hypothetical protein